VLGIEFHQSGLSLVRLKMLERCLRSLHRGVALRSEASAGLLWHNIVRAANGGHVQRSLPARTDPQLPPRTEANCAAAREIVRD